jgi:hypothetical protein
MFGEKVGFAPLCRQFPLPVGGRLGGFIDFAPIFWGAAGGRDHKSCKYYKTKEKDCLVFHK